MPRHHPHVVAEAASTPESNGALEGAVRERERCAARSLERVALAMIAGGAVGNLVDRLRHGAVTDFVSWHWGAHHWPVFNVADVALLIGAVLLAGASFWRTRTPRSTITA